MYGPSIQLHIALPFHFTSIEPRIAEIWPIKFWTLKKTHPDGWLKKGKICLSSFTFFAAQQYRLNCGDKQNNCEGEYVDHVPDPTAHYSNLDPGGRQCLKLSPKSCRSSCLESQIINIKWKKNQQKVPGPPPKLSASDRRTCGNFQHWWQEGQPNIFSTHKL